jgi:CBS domain-containing protein
MTLRAKEIMNKRIMAVTRQVSARDLAVLFLTGTLSGLPVIDHGGKLVGMVSEFDVLKALREKKDLHAVRAEEIMSAIPLCVEEEMTVEDVVRIMLENNLIRLPVVRNDRLVGMISRADVLNHMIEPSLVNVYGS